MNKSAEFTSDDFSPIYGPDKKPEKVGWYVSTWGRLDAVHIGLVTIIEALDLWWWDGANWLTRPASEGGLIATQQKRRWFGLKEDPNV